MNIIQINLTYGIGSTGKIMKDLNDIIEKTGNCGFMVAGYSIENKSDSNLFCLNRGDYLNKMRKDILISRITGEMGYRYIEKTKEAIKWIDSKDPDIIHLHNIHGDWINIKILFEYLKEKDVPVVWTMHDCWPFTGRCSHFENFGCYEWKRGCKVKCKNKVYPLTYFFDKSEKIWNDKYNWFRGIHKMQLVTPSDWLGKFIQDSFLKDYPVMTIHNGIDTATFRPLIKNSKYLKDVKNKKIILGVANSWSEKKGLLDFFELSNLLDQKIYQIVIVGLNKRQMKMIPKSIIGIERTNNQEELVVLYSRAHVFVNPTYQDNFPTTNLEALACGTPIVTYNTGGSPECLIDNNVGYMINKGEINKLALKIKEICSISKDDIMISNIGKKYFDKNVCFNLYMQLYKRLI